MVLNFNFYLMSFILLRDTRTCPLYIFEVPLCFGFGLVYNNLVHS